MQTNRHIQADRRHIHAGRQTGTYMQTDRQTNRHRQADKHTGRHIYRQITTKQTDRNRQVAMQAGRQAGRQAGKARQADRQTDRQGQACRLHTCRHARYKHADLVHLLIHSTCTPLSYVRSIFYANVAPAPRTTMHVRCQHGTHAM